MNGVRTMEKQLFFDDMKLLVRDRTKRDYVKPELVASYNDGISSTDYSGIFVSRLPDGRYRMIYAGKSVDGSYRHLKMFSAISENGVDFLPEKLWDNPEEHGVTYCHEVMDIGNAEIGFIYEDEHCDESERYKMLIFDAIFEEFDFHNDIYTSPDLIHWTKLEGVSWADEAEPLVSVFYNKHKGCYTFMERPYWGVRRLGYKETADWKNFTPWKNVLNIDAEDSPLTELYGMYAFEYDGKYIGIMNLYKNHASQRNAKYHDGVIETQLAISYDGECWNRSLRKSFIGNETVTVNGKPFDIKLIWLFSHQRLDNGDILLYGCASCLEHGPAFRNPGNATILVFRLRKDGVISLVTERNDEASVVATREKIWNGGALSVNIRAEEATAAIFIADDENTLAYTKPVEGMGHGDCIPFSGDSTEWIPEFKSGRSLDELCKKTIVIEIKYKNGELFSISGDFTDCYNTQAARYRKYGRMPDVQ